MGDYTNQKILRDIVSNDENAWSTNNNYSQVQNPGNDYAVANETILRLVPGGLNETESAVDQVLATILALGNSVKALTQKRAFDICFSLLVMFLGFPIFLLILIITKLSSTGPVF